MQRGYFLRTSNMVLMDEPTSSEASPLLPSDPHKKPRLQRPQLAFYLTALLVFLIESGVYFMEMPSARIYEDIICHHYYNNIDGDGHISLFAKIDESLCKGDEVQKELAVLIGGLQMGFAIPGTLGNK